MPLIKDIPEKKRPPASVGKIKVKELKEIRPFVKEKKRQVFSPEVPEKTPEPHIKEKPLKEAPIFKQKPAESPPVVSPETPKEGSVQEGKPWKHGQGETSSPGKIKKQKGARE